MSKVVQLSPTMIRTGLVRLSYPKIFHPEPKKDEKGNTVMGPDGQPVLQYSTALIIPKGSETAKALEECMKVAAREYFNGKPPGSWAKGLRDGDTDPTAMNDPTDPSKGRKPELEGNYWINATSRVKPRVIGRTKDDFTGDFKVLTEGEIKAGDYVYAQINAYGFDVGVNKGVAFGFVAIQLREEGEALSGVAFNAAAFEDDEEIAESF